MVYRFWIVHSVHVSFWMACICIKLSERGTGGDAGVYGIDGEDFPEVRWEDTGVHEVHPLPGIPVFPAFGRFFTGAVAGGYDCREGSRCGHTCQIFQGDREDIDHACDDGDEFLCNEDNDGKIIRNGFVILEIEFDKLMKVKEVAE